jgi:hypothetical protein
MEHAICMIPISVAAARGFRGNYPFRTMTLTEIEQRLAAQLASNDFSGLAGLLNLSHIDYEAIGEYLFKAAGRDVGRLIWKMSLYPAAAVIGLSRAAMKVYGDNFWDNFTEEIGVPVPVTKRPELSDAFCKAAARCIPRYGRANWDAWPHAGEFLAQAGLPLHHCGTFARVLRLAVDETGLPEPTDREGIAETIERMLGRAELHGQTIILKALRGPAGPLLVEAAAAAISAGDYGRFNSELAMALQQSFETLSSRAAGQTIRRPFLQLDRDGCMLEVCCSYPPPARCSGAGCVWSINGARHRAVHGQAFAFPVTKPERLMVELHGLSGGGSLKWTVDARPASWLRGLAAFHAQTGRQVRVEASGNQLLLPPGDYALLQEARWRCDETTSQDEWPEMKMVLTHMTLRPGNSVMFYDGEEEFTLATSKAVWLETSGSTFVSSASGHRVHYMWSQWPTVWIPDDAREGDWTVEVSGPALHSVVPLKLGGQRAGGLAACEPLEDTSFSSLPPGLHRLTMEVRHAQRVKHTEEWLFWAELRETDNGNLKWNRPPTNLLPQSVRGFRTLPDGLEAEPGSDRTRRIGFRVGPETLTLQWQREGIVLESCEMAAGVNGRLVSHQLGESFPADEASKTHLRVSINPANKAVILVNGTVFKRAESNCGYIHFDLSLATLASLHPDGAKIEISYEKQERITLCCFARPMVAMQAAFQMLPSDAGSMKQLLLLLTGRPSSVRLRIKEIISKRSWDVIGCPSRQKHETPSQVTQNAFSVLDAGTIQLAAGQEAKENNSKRHFWFNEPKLPAVKCTVGGKKTLGTSTGWDVRLSIPVDRWPSGVWMIEMEGQREEGASWEVIRDLKGGKIPVVIVQNTHEPSKDYRSHALWYGLASKQQAGFRPSELWPAKGNEDALLATYSEVYELLKERISTVAWQQYEHLRILRGLLTGQVRCLLEQENEDAVRTLIWSLNQEVKTSDSRGLLTHCSELLALPAQHLVDMADDDLLRTCLLWCGRLAETDSIARGFHRLELDPLPTLGSLCVKQSEVAGFFRNGNRIRPDGNLPEGEELTAFDYPGYFARTSKARCDSEVVPASVVPLSGEHLGYAVQQFHSRRSVAEACSSLSNVNTVFSKAALMAAQIKSLVPQFRPLMPQAVWLHPWPEVSVENDHLAESAVQFASVYALAARLAGEKRLSFREFNKWMREQPWLGNDQSQAVNQAVTTLVCQAPELLGFFLMFWQLMIQTYPHD